jgi:hypothetical protein
VRPPSAMKEKDYGNAEHGDEIMNLEEQKLLNELEEATNLAIAEIKHLKASNAELLAALKGCWYAMVYSKDDTAVFERAIAQARIAIVKAEGGV